VNPLIRWLAWHLDVPVADLYRAMPRGLLLALLAFPFIVGFLLR
jgi:hypothetical protein